MALYTNEERITMWMRECDYRCNKIDEEMVILMAQLFQLYEDGILHPSDELYSGALDSEKTRYV